MVTEIIIIGTSILTAQEYVQQDTCVFSDFYCHDECLISNIDKIHFNVYGIDDNRRTNHIGTRCRILERDLFNLDMIRKSLHPV